MYMLGGGDEYVFKSSKLIHRVQADTAIGKGCLHINLLTSRSTEVWGEKPGIQEVRDSQVVVGGWPPISPPTHLRLGAAPRCTLRLPGPPCCKGCEI